MGCRPQDRWNHRGAQRDRVTISLQFVNKGRHLSPAPRVTTDLGRRRRRCRGLRERGRKIDRSVIDILQIRRGKFITGFDLGHATDLEKGRGCPWGFCLCDRHTGRLTAFVRDDVGDSDCADSDGRIFHPSILSEDLCHQSTRGSDPGSFSLRARSACRFPDWNDRLLPADDHSGDRMAGDYVGCALRAGRRASCKKAVLCNGEETGNALDVTAKAAAPVSTRRFLSRCPNFLSAYSFRL